MVRGVSGGVTGTHGRVSAGHDRVTVLHRPARDAGSAVSAKAAGKSASSQMIPLDDSEKSAKVFDFADFSKAA